MSVVPVPWRGEASRDDFPAALPSSVLHWHPESGQGAPSGSWGHDGLSVPKEGEERRCCEFVTLLFSLCAFDTGSGGVSAGERGGPGSHTDWSPVLVHSSGTVQGSCSGWVQAPRSLDGLQPIIRSSHLIPWAAAPPPCSHPLAPSPAGCFCLPHPPHPCLQPVLSAAALSLGRAWENSVRSEQG